MSVLRAPLLGLVALLGAACTGLGQDTIGGSGNVVSSPVAVPGFTRLDVGSAFKVTVSAGAPSVTLHVDSSALDAVEARVSGDTLHIGLETGTDIHDATLSADVSVESLTSVQVSGAAQVTLNGEVDGPSLDLSASGAGQLTGRLGVEHARLDLSGASLMTLSGTTGTLDLQASGASTMRADDLTVGDLAVELSGASSASAAVTGTLSADLSGASALHYTGTPTITHQSVSGGSSLESE